jgi:hypothetical protein
MPKPIWLFCGENAKPPVEGDEENAADSSMKSGWKLDFIRTWKNKKDRVEKLVILDAKYYDVSWSKDFKTIKDQPGIGDIAKQIFYQMAFENLAKENKKADEPNLDFVNAFLFPEDDNSPNVKDSNGNFIISASERVHMGWIGKRAEAFREVNLFAVRLPGIELVRRYATGAPDDGWFERIVNAAPTRTS